MAENTLPTLTFGRTGHTSSRMIFGAAAFWDMPQKNADEAMDLLLAAGVNHVDTAASYGRSEDLLGDWIRRHGRPFFLASKTEKRTSADAYEQIRRSLERLHVDHLDMIQLHALHEEPDWTTALGPGGALEAALRARDEGLARFIGVTGHGVEVAGFHLRALERFAFDAVLLPYNYVMMRNRVYAADFEKLLAVCAQRGVAVQTIKGLTHSPWGNMPQNRTTWYRPLEEQADIDLAVGWVLGNPQVFLNMAGEVALLPHMLEAARRFQRRPSDGEMDALAERLGMAPLFV
ncbi:MAG: aldo/keto reductase [Anaerolineales bacterium]|nr:aldo/keto reductase [Anaerolineales bacterium]